MSIKNRVDFDRIWRDFTKKSVNLRSQKRIDQFIRRTVRRSTGLMIEGYNRL